MLLYPIYDDLRGLQKVELIKSARGQKLGGQTTSSRIFADKTICEYACTTRLSLLIESISADIVKGTKEHPKKDLEALVHDHGAEFTQAQLSDNSAFVISPDDKSTYEPEACPVAHSPKGILVRSQKKKGVSIIKPAWITESIARGYPLPLIEEQVKTRRGLDRADICRLVVFASDDVKADRYFTHSLNELGDENLVRDRTGRNAEEAGETDEDEEGNGEEEVDEAEGIERVADQSRAPETNVIDDGVQNRSQHQKDLEAEWGLESGDEQEEPKGRRDTASQSRVSFLSSAI